MTVHAWLWPDHVIGKRESRVLREEHNVLVNSHAELVAAVQFLQKEWREAMPQTNVRKHFSLLNADAGVSKILAQLTD